MNKLIKGSIGLLSFVALNADIIIAPPPISYSPLDKIGSQTSMQLNYMSVDMDAYNSTGYGIGLSHRIKQTEDTFHNFSFYYMYISGDSSQSSNESETSIYNVSYMYGVNVTPELLGFVGANLNYSSLSNEVPYGSSSGADVYIDTLMYAANAGVQYEHQVSFGALIPWAALTYIVGGSSDTEIYTYGPGGGSSTQTSDIDSFGAYQLGFDIYFDAIATSLSSMYQSASDGDMLSLSLSYNF